MMLVWEIFLMGKVGILIWVFPGVISNLFFCWLPIRNEREKLARFAPMYTFFSLFSLILSEFLALYFQLGWFEFYENFPKIAKWSESMWDLNAFDCLSKKVVHVFRKNFSSLIYPRVFFHFAKFRFVQQLPSCFTFGPFELSL